MRIGNLRHRVQIQRLIETYDDIGSTIYHGETIATAWAAIESATSAEDIATHAIHQKTFIKVAMRYFPGLSVTHHRLINKDIIYNIQSIANHENRWLELICIEGGEYNQSCRQSNSVHITLEP